MAQAGAAELGRHHTVGPALEAPLGDKQVHGGDDIGEVVAGGGGDPAKRDRVVASDVREDPALAVGEGQQVENAQGVPLRRR